MKQDPKNLRKDGERSSFAEPTTSEGAFGQEARSDLAREPLAGSDWDTELMTEAKKERGKLEQKMDDPNLCDETEDRE